MHTATSSDDESYGVRVSTVQTMGAVIAWPLLAALLLAGCAGGGAGETDRADETASPSAPVTSAEPPPTLGGPTRTLALPPERPMDRLEKPIASRLEGKVTGQGLSLDYLDCPEWNGKAPQRLTCTGYLDGVKADVRVQLTKTSTRVNFDAELADGVLATENLVRQLKAEGYADIDCGERPAYPAVVGDRIYCSVRQAGERKYVVATVIDRSGTVQIRDY